jgi:protein TonB
MFEDSLVESTGRIRTHSRQLAVGSFLLQALLLSALIAYPLLHPSALPKQSLTFLLTAPAPPPAPVRLPQQATTTSHASAIVMANVFAAPARIPQHIAQGGDSTAPAGVDIGFDHTGSIPGSDLIDALPAKPMAKPAPPKGPVRISTGVAAGMLLVPIQPVYPAIAKAARIQGTVVVQATISKAGTIENLRAISGPPMLQSAAIDAIRQARYRPFLLNGEPVEVETTINVVFSF